MDARELLEKVGGMEDPDYGRVYIEYGGFQDSRTVLYHEGHWCFDDAKHGHYFTCTCLEDALGFMLVPPTENEWEENIIHYHGPVSPGAMLPRGEHP